MMSCCCSLPGSGLGPWRFPATEAEGSLLQSSPGESGGYDVSFGDPWPGARMTPKREHGPSADDLF